MSLRKKTKDRLIQDYKFISILFFSFWCEPKTRRKKEILLCNKLH